MFILCQHRIRPRYNNSCNSSLARSKIPKPIDSHGESIEIYLALDLDLDQFPLNYWALI